MGTDGGAGTQTLKTVFKEGEKLPKEHGGGLGQQERKLQKIAMP